MHIEPGAAKENFIQRTYVVVNILMRIHTHAHNCKQLEIITKMIRVFVFLNILNCAGILNFSNS